LIARPEGGHFPALVGAKIILRAPDENRDAIMRYFKANDAVAVPKAQHAILPLDSTVSNSDRCAPARRHFESPHASQQSIHRL
jgi:hypothetical protein